MPVVREGSGGPTKVREGSRAPPRGPRWVVRLTRRSQWGLKAHPEILEGLRGPPGGPGGVRIPNQGT